MGSEWNEMLFALPRSQAELMARAVRDHIADCISTLPELIHDERDASIYFYFGNFKAMRRELFPSLLRAFQEWNENGKKQVLLEWIERGQEHWQQVAQQMLEIFRNHGEQSAEHIIKLVENNKL